MEKMKSWAMWLSLGALAIWIFAQLGIDAEQQIQEALSLICPILCAFGIVNNPNDRGTL